MPFLRRDKEPQKDRYIVEAIVYRDPNMEMRWRIFQKMLNGQEIDPRDPDLAGFNDPYWLSGGYMNHDPIAEFERRYQAVQRAEDALFSNDYHGNDPIVESDRRFDALNRATDDLFSYDPIRELDRQYKRLAGTAFIPPDAVILDYRIGLEERLR